MIRPKKARHKSRRTAAKIASRGNAKLNCHRPSWGERDIAQLPAPGLRSALAEPAVKVRLNVCAAPVGRGTRFSDAVEPDASVRPSSRDIPLQLLGLILDDGDQVADGRHSGHTAARQSELMAVCTKANGDPYSGVSSSGSIPDSFARSSRSRPRVRSAPMPYDFPACCRLSFSQS
jgi:hypothetical protein